jgi:hypothetical protein
MQPVVLHRLPPVCLLLTVLCASIGLGGEPEWVRKRPILQEFYVGIGMALKNRPAAEYTEGARNVALNDIASQITVSVSSDVLRKVLESNERLEDEFQSRIRASATADLEGVQVVDTYETGEEYWVYCRLSRTEYLARRAEKLNAASAQSFSLYSSGKKLEREGNVGPALGFYAQAFGPVEKYLTEPLLVQTGEGPVYLVSELYSTLQTLLSRIEARAAVPEQNAKIGRPLAKPLEVTAVLRESGAPVVPDIPFRFAFTRGAGEHVAHARTDPRGIARCPVQKITASDRIQTVEARLDLLALAGSERTTPVVRTVLESFEAPAVRFVLNVSGVEVFVDARESMFGEPLQQKRIEPLLKSELGGRGFAFVDDRSKADFVVRIEADARRGTESFGLFFAFAGATVSLTDRESGRELYKGSITDVKEGSDTFEKAGARALGTLARRIAGELSPRIVEQVHR